MNKKVLGTALLAGLVLGMGSTVYAEEAPKDVIFKQSSVYTLSIPATTEFKDNATSLTLAFGTASRNVEVGKKLNLSIKWTTGDNTVFNLVNDLNQGVTIPTAITDVTEDRPVTNGMIVRTFEDVKLNTLDTRNYKIDFTGSTPRAGSYTGKMIFVGTVD